ncbi:MAG: tetratricopeptide repeat protein [bacterium]|nr:tetratricopeptide repeat protein [bacterium]
MKWNDAKRDIETHLEKLESIVATGKYGEEHIKNELMEIYKQIININAFVKHSDARIKSLAKQIMNPSTSKDGLKTFVQSMKIAPVDLTTYIDKGWNFMVDEQYDDAVEILEKAISLAPNDVKSLGLLGWAYIHKERYDDAMSIFQTVLQLDPDNAIAKNNLGFVCFKKGIFGEAIEHLTSVIKATEDKMSLIYAHFYLGLIYLDREMYEDAIRFLLKTIELGPNHMEAYYYLGLAYFESGKENKGVKTLKDLIKKNRYNRWAQKAEEKLKELTGENNEKEN